MMVCPLPTTSCAAAAAAGQSPDQYGCDPKASYCDPELLLMIKAFNRVGAVPGPSSTCQGPPTTPHLPGAGAGQLASSARQPSCPPVCLTGPSRWCTHGPTGAAMSCDDLLQWCQKTLTEPGSLGYSSLTSVFIQSLYGWLDFPVEPSCSSLVGVRNAILVKSFLYCT
jgi:hypothetical protein